jgi:GT2 family glycosyltransferase
VPRALENARGDIIAFIDSDCVASQNWIENITKTFCEDNDIYILTGKTFEIQSYEDIIDNNYYKYHVKREIEAKRFLHFALTENFAFKRAIVGHVENFDARFRQGGEDYDFCVRLVSKGYNILYKPDVVIYHLRRSFKSSIKKAWKDGCSRCHVFMKHRSRVLRDFIVILFHALAIIFLLMLMACKLIGIFLSAPYSHLRSDVESSINWDAK